MFLSYQASYDIKEMVLKEKKNVWNSLFLPLNVEGWPAFLQELRKGIAWFVSNE